MSCLLACVVILLGLIVSIIVTGLLVYLTWLALAALIGFEVTTKMVFFATVVVWSFWLHCFFLEHKK